MSERFETKRCIKALYKYSSFPFLFFSSKPLYRRICIKLFSEDKHYAAAAAAADDDDEDEDDDITV